MAIDIVFEGLEVNENGLLPYDQNEISGILSLSWIYCRPDLPQSVLNWSIKLDSIQKKQPVNLNDFAWYQKLAFRQNAVGKSVIKIELITAKDYPLIAKLVAGLVGFGVKTVGGLIINPVAASLYDTLTSQIELTNNPTLYKLGTAELEINPDLPLPNGVQTIDLELKSKFVIQPGSTSPLNGQKTPEFAIPKGKNGAIKLSIKDFAK
ncbi:MAG: hypothetical protein ACT6RZ_09310 [Methylophilus sp.]|uniref:hypothetical protein n=1 Tax=Methylophilus sp. TaxID=29541 RepID=UPI0040354339